MIHHISYELKSVGDISRKVHKMLLVEKFRNYMQNTIYGLHKALGRDGSDTVYGGAYLMSLNIQYPFTNVAYDNVNYIIEKMQE